MLWHWTVSLSYAGLACALTITDHDRIPSESRSLEPQTIFSPSDAPFLDSEPQGWDAQCAHDIAASEDAPLCDVEMCAARGDVFCQEPNREGRLGILPMAPPSSQDEPIYHESPWDLTSLTNTTFHSTYHPLYEINQFMEDMANTYEDVVELVNLGHSAEGREMIAMRLSKDPASDAEGRYLSNTKKLAFVITGAQHAREWIATSTALYLTHALVADASESFALSSWLDNFNFYIVPVPNPDGYIYTWEKDRLWYKNRQIIGPAEKCTGIDMNRNWGYKWKSKSRLPAFANGTDEYAWFVPSKGAGADPCSTWYPGHRPFESPEVNNIANYITTIPSLKAFIDLRSYGQMLSTPYSFSCKKTPKDAEDLLEAALGAANAIKQAHGTVFTIGSLCDQLYRASGNVVDYMYKMAGIKYSYSVHLRDTGTYGFSLPAEWIRPVGEETANMVRFIAAFITK